MYIYVDLLLSREEDRGRELDEERGASCDPCDSDMAVSVCMCVGGWVEVGENVCVCCACVCVCVCVCLLCDPCGSDIAGCVCVEEGERGRGGQEGWGRYVCCVLCVCVYVCVCITRPCDFDILLVCLLERKCVSMCVYIACANMNTAVASIKVCILVYTYE